MDNQNPRSIVRRSRPAVADLAQARPQSLSHSEAFAEAYGRNTYQVRQTAVKSRQSDSATRLAAACIAACEGLSPTGLQEGGIRELIEAARATQKLLSGRLIRSDPEVAVVLAQLSRALRRLGV